MKTKISFAFLTSALVGGLLSSCYVPEPAFECTPATTEFAGHYTLVSGTAGGACTMYSGDLFRVQKYQAPGASSASIAVLATNMGKVTRVKNGDVLTGTGVFARVDPSDPNYAKESARGPLSSIAADSKGVCSATLAPADQNLPAVSVHTADFPKDGGVKNLPATHIKYDWKNFRFLNTARFPGTIVSAQLDVTVDACQATYDVEAIWPTVDCTTDEDCNPNANLDAGRVSGSGLSPDYAPKCDVDFGECIPTVSFDDLAKLQ